jgi:hypothetical protein
MLWTSKFGMYIQDWSANHKSIKHTKLEFKILAPAETGTILKCLYDRSHHS